MTATVSLIVSIAGIGVLVLLKQWENKRDSVPWQGARERLDSRVERAGRFVRVGLPRLAKHVFSELVHAVAYHASAAVLLLIRLTERRLLRFVNMIKGRREVRANGGTSTFLKDVTEHKNHLRRRNGIRS